MHAAVPRMVPPEMFAKWHLRSQPKESPQKGIQLVGFHLEAAGIGIHLNDFINQSSIVISERGINAALA